MFVRHNETFNSSVHCSSVPNCGVANPKGVDSDSDLDPTFTVCFVSRSSLKFYDVLWHALGSHKQT